MNKHKSDTQKMQQIFHFDEQNIEKICASLESEIEMLKVVKSQNQPFKTADVEHFNAALYETETITLLELPSLAPSKNISNDSYNVKVTETTNYMLSDAVQASRCFQRSQHTQTDPITLNDQSNIASVWILQKEMDNEKSLASNEDHPKAVHGDIQGEIRRVDSRRVLLSSKTKIDMAIRVRHELNHRDIRHQPKIFFLIAQAIKSQTDQWPLILMLAALRVFWFSYFREIESNNFKKMLFITDRIVTSNVFSKNQIEFITQHKSDKLNAMSYRYTLEEILTFSNVKIAKFAVTSFVWNTTNEDILAVGYGRWDDESQNIKGIVCCWSLKNPIHPERMYEFEKPITCLDFSKTSANILFAGSYGGFIYSLDISQEICVPVIINEKCLQNFPVWSIVSFMQKSYTSEDEFLLSVDGNGSVRKWSADAKTCNTEQMSLIYCGIRNDSGGIAKPNKYDSTIVQNMPGTVISFHPTDKSTYFVGTKVGFVVKNTIDSYDHYDSIFTAHNGPVYGVKFSPFCSSIFITYGADWQIKIWMENVESPLLSLCYCNAVDDADWSPINSTVIVSVSGAVICIWDFARKTVEPVMLFSCNTGVHFSLVKFSKHGNNIIAGDKNGLIRCFHINNMPSPSFLQKNSILTALENMMSSNQELVQIIKKIMLN